MMLTIASKMPRNAASYTGLAPASAHASSAARGSSKKTDTKPELILRRALWRAGLRYRKNVSTLPGKPDIVFPGARVAVFCDGDFWHGKAWKHRREKLSSGTNPDYWIRKIEGNMKRDRAHNRALLRAGWRVLRCWESDILRELSSVVSEITEAVRTRSAR